MSSRAGDGWPEADDNIAENPLRTVSLERNNHHGDERGALLYGLILSCRLNVILATYHEDFDRSRQAVRSWTLNTA